MKENTENNNRRLKVYWGVREWLHSMYPTYLKWLILPLILIMLIGLDKQTDETIVNTITSVYAGILSSVIVTALVQKRQDKLSLDKKKAILFDATFLLNDFSKKYLALEDKGKDNWMPEISKPSAPCSSWNRNTVVPPPRNSRCFPSM